MGAIGHDGLAVPGKVVLAHEPPFVIGSLRVDPATRQIEADDRSETLEPRVMEVLVALYRAGGIVTRDELIQRCWDGRVVGEDAINRVISRIRAVAAEIGGGSFTVETITKVGYRIVATGSGQGPAANSAAPSAGSSRRAALAGLGAAGLVGAGLLAASLSTRPDARKEQARSLYDRAMALRYEAQPGSPRQSLAYLREAVRLDPDFGKAWGALALTYRALLAEEPFERTAGFDALLADAVRQARRLDPGNPEAEAAALIDESRVGAWHKQDAIIRSLLRRHPDQPVLLFGLGSLMMDVGRWREAVALWRRHKRVSPYSPIGRYKMIVSLWSAGAINEVDQEIEEAMSRWPQHSAIWQTKIKVLALTGRAQAALAFASDQTASPIGEERDNEHRLRWLRALASRSAADADAVIAGQLDLVRETPSAATSNALFIANLGRPELSLDLLEGFYLGEGDWGFTHPKPTRAGLQLTTHPLFQPHASSLWGQSRFSRLLERIGLEDYWRKSNSIPDFRRA